MSDKNVFTVLFTVRTLFIIFLSTGKTIQQDISDQMEGKYICIHELDQL